MGEITDRDPECECIGDCPVCDCEEANCGHDCCPGGCSCEYPYCTPECPKHPEHNPGCPHNGREIRVCQSPIFTLTGELRDRMETMTADGWTMNQARKALEALETEIAKAVAAGPTQDSHHNRDAMSAEQPEAPNAPNTATGLPAEALLAEIAGRIREGLAKAPPIDDSQEDQGPAVTLSFAAAALNAAADMLAKTKAFYGIEV